MDQKSTRRPSALPIAAAMALLATGVLVLGSSGGTPSVEARAWATAAPTSEFQQGKGGYQGCADTYIALTDAGSHCSGSQLQIKGDGSQRGLIRFDLSGVTQPDTVQVGYLELFVQYGSPKPAFNSLKAHLLLRGWDCEEVNWDQAIQNQKWSTPGGQEIEDYSRDPEGNGYPSPDRSGFYRFEIRRETLQSWLTDPSSNRGLLLLGQGGYKTFLFVSSEDPRQALRPILVIVWGEPTPAAPTYTPYPTFTRYPTYTPYPTGTPVTHTPSGTPPTPTETSTPTVTPTETVTPTRTATSTGTPPTPTATSYLPTYTPYPTYTREPTYTPGPTYTPITPAPTYTEWPTYTPQPTYTAYPTYTPMLPTPTGTVPTPTKTPTSSRTPTGTSSPSPTFTPSGTPPTPTATSYWPTYTPRPTYTDQATYTPRPTYTTLPTWTATSTPTATPSVTSSATPTAVTPTPTPTTTPPRAAYLPVLLRGCCLPQTYVQNGDFEAGDLGCWVHGGGSPQQVVESLSSGGLPYHGKYCAELGTAVECISHTASTAWMFQDVYIPRDASSAKLGFSYRILTNDVYDWASFRAELRAVNGALLATILREGHRSIYRICSNDLGWRVYEFDLTPWRGQTLRLWFASRNEWDGGWGVWTYVDSVSIALRL